MNIFKDIIIIGLMATGIYLALIYDPKLLPLRFSLKGRLKTLADRQLSSEMGQGLFQELDSSMTIKEYNYLRCISTVALLVYVTMRGFSNGVHINYLIYGYMLVLLFFYLSKPALNIGKRKSLFAEVMGKLIKIKNEKMDEEIYQNCIVLKNFAIISEERPLSADYLFEQLFNSSNKMKNYYGRMLSLYREGQRERAFEYLEEKVSTKTCKSYTLILSKLDQLKPSEMVGQIEVFQEIILDQRYTKAIKTIERNSLIVTITSTVSIFALLLNFAVVVVFMDTLSLLENIF